MQTEFDVIVVGGGHAGCEAAAVAARAGANVALLSMRRDMIGAMSCNPAIGGLGKGHLVREVDACDGLLGRAADEAAIHYRMLNMSKGPAVQGPRVQADRRRIKAAINRALGDQPGLSIVEGEASRLEFADGRVAGLSLSDGRHLKATAVVLATGTFLQARMHCGEHQVSGGRVGEPAADTLGAQLRGMDIPVGRLKTGTPPRLDGRTIDWSRLVRQDSDRPGWTMSPLGSRSAPALFCAITRTNAETHRIVREAMDRSPLRSGAINGSGPRYCPSVEEKIIRFGDRDGHQIFLEPEGLDDPLIYPNGFSTSLPEEVQDRMVRSMIGLESAVIAQYGYAVEYDYVDPRALDSSLALRVLPGLYLAGQINGTTGYEEAAAQGLVAGLNAARFAQGRPSVRFDRASSYIGVLIDDLVLHGVTEPYRMLTARAEHRLRLRSDNASRRLTPMASELGIVGRARRDLYQHMEARRAELRIAGSRAAPRDGIDRDVLNELRNDHLYAPYVARQDVERARIDTSEAVVIPDIDYGAIPGLSTEMVSLFSTSRPSTLGEASRLRSVTPAALGALLVHIHGRQR